MYFKQSMQSLNSVATPKVPATTPKISAGSGDDQMQEQRQQVSRRQLRLEPSIIIYCKLGAVARFCAAARQRNIVIGHLAAAKSGVCTQLSRQAGDGILSWLGDGRGLLLYHFSASAPFGG